MLIGAFEQALPGWSLNFSQEADGLLYTLCAPEPVALVRYPLAAIKRGRMLSPMWNLSLCSGRPGADIPLTHDDLAMPGAATRLAGHMRRIDPRCLRRTGALPVLRDARTKQTLPLECGREPLRELLQRWENAETAPTSLAALLRVVFVRS